jgi:uncharacterized protein YdcH (DUF465 family)
VVGKSRTIFSAAERDTEAWVRSLLPPLEMQVREQRTQLKKRTDSVTRIRDAQESLDSRIGQLEDALQDVQAHLDELKKISDGIGFPRPVEVRPSPEPPRAASLGGDGLPSYLRVEI